MSMRNLSVKNVLITGLSAIILLVGSACLEPSNLDKFYNDDAVQGKLKRDRVTLIDKSGDNLKAGNAKITGLKIGKYYITEKWNLVEKEGKDENEIISELEYDQIYYVGSEGHLDSSPKNIVMTTKKEKEIKDPLKTNDPLVVNGNTYKVFSSAALTGEMTLYNEKPASNGGENPPVDENPPDNNEDDELNPSLMFVPSAAENAATGKKVTATGKGLELEATNETHYLELPATFIKEGNDLNIIIVQAPANSSGHTKYRPNNGNIIELQGGESTTDYLLIQQKEDKDGNYIIESFNILRVIIGKGSGGEPSDDECDCGNPGCDCEGECGDDCPCCGNSGCDCGKPDCDCEGECGGDCPCCNPTFTINLTITGDEGDDRVSFHATNDVKTTTGKAGDSITIYYKLANYLANSQLLLSGGDIHETIKTFQPGTKTYIVNATDAIAGVITFSAEFTHTNKEIDNIEFEDNDPVVKIYGDAPFPRALTNTGVGTGTITYSSNDTAVATVNNDGVVTILKRSIGSVTITATKEEDSVYKGATASYQLTVNPKNVTITGVTAVDKVYNGNPDADVTGTPTVEGKVPSDPVSVVPGTATFDSKNVGSRTVTFSDFSLGNNTDGNYNLTGQPASVTADITALQLTVTGLTVESTKEYDGSNHATIVNHGTNNGATTDDLTITPTATYNNKNVLNGKTVTVKFAISGADAVAGNYIKPDDKTFTADITKGQPLTIGNPDLTTSKEYDGYKTAAVTAGSLIGVFSGDTVNVTASAEYDTATVGTGKTITVVYTIIGADADNYTEPANYVVFDGEITCTCDPDSDTCTCASGCECSECGCTVCIP